MKMTIDVAPDGTSRWIHNDALAGMLDLPGKTTIRRASHVEPGDPAKGQNPLKWYADMAPVNGPVLGPFGKRGEALNEEVIWLKKHHLGITPTPEES